MFLQFYKLIINVCSWYKPDLDYTLKVTFVLFRAMFIESNLVLSYTKLYIIHPSRNYLIPSKYQAA